MARPSLKSTVPYFSDADGLHFRMAGEFLSIDDSDGRIGALLRLLDGSRDPDAVFAALTETYPDVTRAEFDEALEVLDDSHLLHDAAADRNGLGEDQCERWSRNLGFFETYSSMAVSKYDFQHRIARTKVAMLGLGGVGSHVFMDMVAMGFTDIRIVDFDVVELSNLNRQVLYGEDLIGGSKVQLAARWARQYHGDLRLDVVQRRLGSAQDVYDVVADRDVVIAAIDRPKSKALLWLNEGCVRAGAALVTGGVDTQRAIHFTVVPGLSGCVQCWRSSVDDQDGASRDLFARIQAQDEAGIRFGEDMAAFDGMVVLQVAFLVGELVRLSTAIAPPLSVGRMLQVLFHNPVLTERESWTRRPDCPVCGSASLASRFAWLPDAVTPAPSLRPGGIWPDD